MENERLLILDDDLPMGEMIEDIAATIGVPARYTSDPATFLRVAKEWNPTHIVIDLKMPQMDGMEVMNHLAEQRCSAAVIISSGACKRVLDASARSASGSGLSIAGILPKPFMPDDLRRLVTRTLPIYQPEGVSTEAPREAFNISPFAVKQAFERGELQAFYQPKIMCSSGQLVGFEALARWKHPRHGLIMPDLFIPVMEANGMIGELTRLMLDQSLSFLSRLKVSEFAQASSGAPRLTMAVNITSEVLEQHDFAEKTLDACLSHGVDPDQLILELTESSEMGSSMKFLAMLTRLGIRGFHLSIDDFGSGYSSMLRLVKLPFSEIKIDKSFVISAMDSEESRSVIRSIVSLGHGLGLQTVAEGVEDAPTFEFLNTIGCDVAQGYLISRPIPEVELFKWMGTMCAGRRWSS